MPAIYTRTGDGGDTGLYGGSRVAKDDLRVEAYGTVDEANTFIGNAKCTMSATQFRDDVHKAQQRLFVLAAELASDETGRSRLAALIDGNDIAELEKLIDRCLVLTGPPTEFVVPGRDEASAAFHVARSAVRRAERRVITLSAHDTVRPELVKYLNRLSDALYAIARVQEQLHDRTIIEQIVRRHLLEAGLVAMPGADFTLQVAELMATAAQREAERMDVPIVFAAVDANGDTLLLHRMPGALLVSPELAVNKAWTAAALRQPTDQLQPQVVESGPLYGLAHSNQGRIVTFGGGIPLWSAGKLVGAVGVSGGTVEEDIHLATTAINATGEWER